MSEMLKNQIPRSTKKEKNESMTAYEHLKKELFEAGLENGRFLDEELSCIDTLINTKTSSKPYRSILMSYLDKLKGKELEMVVRALTEKGIEEVAPQLVLLFNEENTEQKSLLWTVGNALSVIDDKTTYAKVLEICSEPKFGEARQMLLATLRKIRTEESFNLLLECLDDVTIRGHALIELRKWGDVRALTKIEHLVVQKGLLEAKEKNKAIEKLKTCS